MSKRASAQHSVRCDNACGPKWGMGLRNGCRWSEAITCSRKAYHFTWHERDAKSTLYGKPSPYTNLSGLLGVTSLCRYNANINTCSEAASL